MIVETGFSAALSHALVGETTYSGPPTSIKTSLFEAMRLSNPHRDKSNSPTITRQQIKTGFEVLFVALNSLALLEDQALRNSDSGVVVGFWDIVRLLRVDYLFYVEGMSGWWLCGIWGVVGFLTLYLGLLAVLIHRGSSIPNCCFQLYHYTAWVCCVLLQSSVVTIVCVSFSPLFGSQSTDLALGSLASYFSPLYVNVLSLLTYALFCLHCLFFELSTCVFDHERRRDHFQAKSGAELSLFDASTVHLTVFSYVFLSPEYPTIHCTVFFLLWGLITLLYFVRYPHYASLCTVFHLCKSGFLTWSAGSVLVSKANGIDITHVFLICVVTPVVLALLSHFFRLYEIRSMKFAASRIQASSSQSQIEHGLRFHIFRSIDPTLQPSDFIPHAFDVLTHFQQIRNRLSKEDGPVLLWEASFCLLVLEDEKLARMRLALLSGFRLGFISAFYAYRVKKDLSTNVGLDDVNYLKFRLMIEDVKTVDELLCRKLDSFWSELAIIHPQGSKVMRLCAEIHDGIKLANKKYKQLLKEYPRQPEVLDLFGSFLAEVMGMPDKANTWRVKSQFFKESEEKRLSAPENDWNVGYFDQGACIVLASVSPLRLGRILYSNFQAADALGYTYDLFLTQRLLDLIPPIYREQHKKWIREFVGKAKEPVIKHPVLLYLYTSHGHILECQTRMSITSVGGQGILLLAFKPSRLRKEVAMLSEDGKIQAHTVAFPMFLGTLGIKSVEGMRLQDLNQELASLKASFSLFKRVKLAAPINVYALFANSLIGMRRLDLVFLFKTDRDAALWLKRFRKANGGNLYRSKALMGDYEDAGEVLMMPRERSKSMILNDIRKVNVKFQEMPEVHSYSLLSLASPEASKIVKSGDEISSLQSQTNIATSFTSSFSGNKDFSRSDFGRTFTLKLHKSFKLIRFLVFGTVRSMQFLLLASGNIITAEYIIATVEQKIADSDADILSLYRLTSAKIYEVSRFIDTGQKMEIGESRAKLGEHLQYFQSLSATIRSHISEAAPGPYQAFFISPYTLTWELQDSQVVSVKRSLLDAMETLIINVNVRQGLKVSSTNDSSVGLFYLQRNAVSETYSAMNLSSEYYIQEDISSIDYYMNQTYWSVVALFLLLGISGILAIPLFLTIQKSSDFVSRVFLSYPLSLYLEQKKKAVDRLKEVHGIDADYGISHSARIPRKLILFRTWVGPGVYFALYAGGCFLVYLLVYFTGVPVIITDLTHNPKQLNAFGSSLTAAFEMWLWLFDFQTLGTRDSVYQLPGYIQHRFPSYDMNISAANLHYYNTEYTTEVREGEFYMSDALYTSFYEALDGNCSLYAKGLLNGLNTFSQEVFSSTSVVSETTNSEVFLCAEELFNLAPGYMADIEGGNLSRLQNIEVLVVLATVCYLAFSAFLLLFVLLKTIANTQSAMKKVWRLISLVPIESTLQATGLNRGGRRVSVLGFAERK